MTRHEKRPYVICHILASVDGRISGPFFGEQATGPLVSEYAALRPAFEADAFAYGAATVNQLFVRDRHPEPARVAAGQVPAGDFVRADAERYLLALDPDGTLGWTQTHVQRPGMEGARVIELLTEQVPEGTRAYFRAHDVAYIVAGTERLDLTQALERLARDYGIERVLLQGGGVADAMFFAEGLIDELSLVVAPVIDGSDAAQLIGATPAELAPQPVSFSRLTVRRLGDAGLWLDYRR
ncbi:MAG: RibD family protein [Coriobacteriales bacterium]